MKKVIWFSRHPISFDERAAIKEWVDKNCDNDGIDIEIIDMKAEAQKVLTSASDVAEVYKNIADTAKDNACSAVFGVFPAPIREMMTEEHLNDYMNEFRYCGMGVHSIPAFEAWNVARPPLPEDNMPRSMVVNPTPMFKFKKWCYVGKVKQ